MLINGKNLDEEKVLQLILDIKKKKELKEINDAFVRDTLFKFLQQESKLTNQLIKSSNTKSASYKQVIKNVRAKLRRVYGLFRFEEKIKKRKDLIKELDQPGIIDEILQTHSSTKERLEFYDKLYQKIFSITGEPKVILDLGSGINPFSFSYMRLKKCTYYAYDISEEEVGNLNKYFKKLHQENKNFKGKAEILDLLHFVKLKKADVAFLFKMTDVLDIGKGHKVAEEVIKKIPAKYVVVSFPTKTMSGKKMNFPRRKWIELMCERLKFKYKYLEFENELFYVISLK